MEGGWSMPLPGRFTPGNEPGTNRIGGGGASEMCVWKISSLQGFDPRTVQPVASRYTDYAIPALGMTIV